MRFGISVALATPFREDGRVDEARLLRHAHSCLARGCRSVTAFGTTGEGPSVPPQERDRVAAALIAGGIAPEKLVEGVIANSPEEAAASTRSALARGSRAVLLAPPSYFRGMPDEAVFAWFAEVFRLVGPGLRDVILYHIPGMTGVPITPALVGRLREAYPSAVLGVKDSSCDEAGTMRLLEAHRDLVILVGDERYLGRACAAGGSGSICGLANLAPEAVIAVAESGRDDPRIADIVNALSAHSVIPMVKALVAELAGDPAWATARPPLPTLRAEARALVPLVERLREAEAAA